MHFAQHWLVARLPARTQHRCRCHCYRAAARGADAIIWRALRPKFEGVDGNAPATAEAALSYLKQLDAKRMVKAQEYVERAPAQMQTAFRAAFEEELGWNARS